MPGNKPEWSTQGGVARMTKPARVAEHTLVPKARLERAIEGVIQDIGNKTARIVELQTEVDDLNTELATMEAVLADVTSDPPA